jgi:hypothetical protein
MPNARIAVLPSLLLAACGRTDSPPPSASPQSSAGRDSSGVLIVEHRSFDSIPIAFTLSVPITIIGRLSSEAKMELDPLLSSAIRLSNGNVIVPQRMELRVFDSMGRFVRAIGREGQGPGEFSRANHMVFRGPGDTIVAFDPGQTRLSFFDSAGKFVRSAVPDGGVAGLLRTGDLAVSRARNATARDTVVVLAVGGAMLDRVLDTLLVAKTNELIRDSGPGRAGAMASRPAPPPRPRPAERPAVLPKGFSVAPMGVTNITPLPQIMPTQSISIGGSRVAFALGNEFRVDVRTAGGRPLSIRAQATPRAVTEEDRAKFREFAMADVPDVERTVRAEMLDRSPLPATWPLYGRVVVDRRDRIWVEEFHVPWERRSSWVLFDTTGSVIGRVSAPKTMQLMFADDAVAVFKLITPDDYHLTQIEVYRLQR